MLTNCNEPMCEKKESEIEGLISEISSRLDCLEKTCDDLKDNVFNSVILDQPSCVNRTSEKKEFYSLLGKKLDTINNRLTNTWLSLCDMGNRCAL
jgi:hypothetical protein